jgi:hypothetical protein
MSNGRQEVVVTDIKIPFLSMVVLLVKWALAAIPALIILFFIFSILGIIFGGLFHGDRFWMT